MTFDCTSLSRHCFVSVVVAVLTIGWGCSPESTAPEAPVTPPDAALGSSVPPVIFQGISSNTFNSCGVTSDARIFCWPGSKQIHGEFVSSTLHFRQVSVGGDHVCAVTEDDLAYCWGANFDAQLGDGTLKSRTTPVAVLGGRQFLQIQAGGFHTCGLTRAHEAFCWGRNAEGQVGDGSSVNRRFQPVRVAGGLLFSQIVAGQAHNCGATTDHRGFCWGYAGDGQIGDGKVLVQRSTPRAVIGGLSFRFLSAGNSHSCGLTTTNRAYCWGSNEDGRLGTGNTTSSPKPVAVIGGLQFSTINAGGDHTCGVSTTHTAYCWGNNATGQVGDNSKTDRFRPTTVSGGLEFAGVDAGGAVGESSFSCGTTTTARAYCWGWNEFGTLGNDKTEDSSTPVPVLAP